MADRQGRDAGRSLWLDAKRDSPARRSRDTPGNGKPCGTADAQHSKDTDEFYCALANDHFLLIYSAVNVIDPETDVPLLEPTAFFEACTMDYGVWVVAIETDDKGGAFWLTSDWPSISDDGPAVGEFLLATVGDSSRRHLFETVDAAWRFCNSAIPLDSRRTLKFRVEQDIYQ